MKAMLVGLAVWVWFAGCTTNSGPPMTSAAARDLNSPFAGALDPEAEKSTDEAAIGEKFSSSNQRDESRESAQRPNHSRGLPAQTESGEGKSKTESRVQSNVTFWVYAAIGAGLLAYLLILVRRRSRLS